MMPPLGGAFRSDPIPRRHITATIYGRTCAQFPGLIININKPGAEFITKLTAKCTKLDSTRILRIHDDILLWPAMEHPAAKTR